MAVSSWNQLQEVIGEIVDALNADPNLVRAAAVNPLLALEELGYRITPEARHEIEERLRFDPRQVVRRRELRTMVFREAGKTFDLNSASALHDVLFEELGLTAPPDERGCYPPSPDTSPLPPQLSYHERAKDPLELLRGRHPIIDLLLEYRRLEASRPHFAPPTLYAEVRKGDRTLGITRVHARLKDPPTAGPSGGREGAAGGPEPTAAGPFMGATGPAGAAPEAPAGGPAAAPRAGRIDVNTATEEELATLPGIGPKLAARIVAFRAQFGPFDGPEALTLVRGVSHTLSRKLRPYVFTGGDRA